MDLGGVFNGRLLDNLDDGILVISMPDRVVCHVNTPFHQQFRATGIRQVVGTKYVSIDPSIERIINNHTYGHRTLKINSGSAIKYCHFYLFPLNSSYYVIVSRDITKTFLRHRKDREYRSLFLLAFNLLRIPMAVIDTHGVVHRFNPTFFNLFDSTTTVSHGSLIWEHFGDDRPKIKELVDELHAGQASSFEHEGLRFVALDRIKDAEVDEEGSPRLVLVYGLGIPCSTDINAQDFKALFKILKWAETLPWRLIAFLLIGLGSVVGLVDLSTLVQILLGNE